MAFSFGGVRADSKKTALKLQPVESVVIADTCIGDGKDVNILMDYLYPSRTIEVFMDWLRSCGLRGVKIIYALNCKASRAQASKEGVIKFYRQNCSDIYKYMIPTAPVITVGPALYTLLQESDIYPSHAEQAIFGKSNFFFSKDLTSANGHWVHPIASLEAMFENSDSLAKGEPEPRDCIKVKLAEIQFYNLAHKPFKVIPRYPKLNKIFIESIEDFNERFYEPNKNRVDEVLAWDTETSGFDFNQDELGCITLSFDGITGYYIPWKYVDKKKLGEILKNNRQLGANLKFDVKWLWRNGVPEAHIDEDVILAGHTLDETRMNSLKALAYYYSEYGGYERDLDNYIDKTHEQNYLHIPEELLREYAVMDAIVTKRVWNNIMAHMRELDAKYPNEFSDDGFLEYYYLRRIPAANMYATFEYNGCYVSKSMLSDLRKTMKDYLVERKLGLSKMFGVSANFDWGSAHQLGKLLEEKGWEDLGRTADNTYETSVFQLQRWEKTHKEEASALQNMRSVSVLLNTFVGDDAGSKGWSQYLQYHPEDDSHRMHASYQAMLTDAGRTRCSNPNLQNTPTRGMFAKEIKSCIRTCNDNDYYMVTIDYAALQGRIAAMDYEINDELKDVFRGNRDFHSKTGWLVFCSEKDYEISTITVTLDDGSTFETLGGEVTVTTDGDKFGKDLAVGDTLTHHDNKKITNVSCFTETRRITEQEFVRQKSSQPFKWLRECAKNVNFLCIFGGSPKVLADSSLETSWTPQMIDDYIEENHCEPELERAQTSYAHESSQKQRYIAVATRIQDGFFKGYPGLKQRIKREQAYAKAKGYCRMLFGASRNMIELWLRGAYDNVHISQTLRNLENIAANCRAQNHESCIRGRAQYELQMWLIREGYLSRAWNEIHDSADFWIKKEELHDVMAHAKHLFERQIPELRQNWVPLKIDCEISDLLNGGYYKGGDSPESFGLTWKNLEYEDPDPFNVEQAIDFEKEYFENRAKHWEKKGVPDPLADKIQEYLKGKTSTYYDLQKASIKIEGFVDYRHDKGDTLVS